MGRNRKSSRGSGGGSVEAAVESLLKSATTFQEQAIAIYSSLLARRVGWGNFYHASAGLVMQQASFQSPSVHRALLKKLRAQDRLSWADQLVLYAIGIVGTPEVRREALLLWNDIKQREVEKLDRIFVNIDGVETEVHRPIEVLRRLSLDQMVYDSLYEVGISTTRAPNVVPNIYDLTDEQADKLMSNFIQKMTNEHAEGDTYNFLGAAMQTALTKVGPNIGLPYKSFYPPMVNIPEPHPLIVSLLRRQYRQVQDEYAKDGITEIALARGMGEGLQLGIPMSPWTDNGNIAAEHAEEPENLMYIATVPVRYVFLPHWHKNFNTPYSETEYLVLETALARNASVLSTKTRGDGLVTKELAIKDS